MQHVENVAVMRIPTEINMEKKEKRMDKYVYRWRIGDI